MNFLNTFLMWFPPCALFVAVAYVTEMAWSYEDHMLTRWFLRSIKRMQCDACRGSQSVRPRLYGGSLCDECHTLMGVVNGRPVLRDERGIALMYLD